MSDLMESVISIQYVPVCIFPPRTLESVIHALIKLASTDEEMCTDFGTIALSFACLESCIVEASDCL